MKRIAERSRLSAADMQWVDLESLVWVLEPDLEISAADKSKGVLSKKIQLFHKMMRQMATQTAGHSAGGQSAHSSVVTNPLSAMSAEATFNSKRWADVRKSVNFPTEQFERQVVVAQYYESQVS
jgi:hypothetical protein